MKFIIILILSLSYTKTILANTCHQALTSQEETSASSKEMQRLQEEVTVLQRDKKRRQENWDTAILAVGTILFPPTIFIYAIAKLFENPPPSQSRKPKSLNTTLVERFHKPGEVEAAKRHIQQLEEILELPQKEAIRLALSSLPFRFDSITHSQQLFAEMDHLTSRWGISKPVALQSIKAHQYIEQNTDEILQEISKVLEEKGQFSKEEAKQVIQSLKTIKRDLIFNFSKAISALSQAGFTHEQIISIMKLDVVRTDNSLLSFKLFHREKTSLKEKRERLRQVGFTEEEINRIPIHIMERTKGDIAKSTLLLSYVSGMTILALDGLQWILTGSSIIW